MSGTCEVLVLRGPLVESAHDIAVVGVAAGGAVAFATDGAVELPVFLRSAAKPFQAAPAVARGVLDRFGLDDRHLALACASHVATPEHVALAAEILAAAGLDEAALQCGPGDDGRPLAHGCSGNHALGLALCVQEGWPTASYLEASHPLQEAYRSTIAAIAGAVPEEAGDGCGMRAYRIPLRRYAGMFGLLGAAGDGAPPAYRDSGMAGSPAAAHPRAWAGADLADAAAAVRATLDEVRPDVVVTYDSTGGYGHPDHVRTHDATCRAVASSADAPLLYAVLTPLSWAVEDRLWLAEHVPTDRGLVVPGDDDPFASSVVPDAVVTHTVVDPSVVPLQSRALMSHETQVVVGEGWYALSNHVVSRLAGREGYARLDAATGRPTSEDPA